MLKQLDPHSTYYTRDKFRELTNDNLGQYFGTGITIADFKRDGVSGTYIISVTRARRHICGIAVRRSDHEGRAGGCAETKF
jgi:C-terminal processing protease CtpA/Prc